MEMVPSDKQAQRDRVVTQDDLAKTWFLLNLDANINQVMIMF